MWQTSLQSPPPPPFKSALRAAFTLIELAIVLVIVGLVAGGVLVGKDLIGASALRATATQYEKFNTAVNTFRDKYGGIPGDLNAPAATQFGFVARAGTLGRGNGDFLLEGYCYSNGNYYGWNQGGETLFFWEDLVSAHLIEGGFGTATDGGTPNVTASSSPNLDAYLPAAKLGNGNYFYVYSTGNNQGSGLGGSGINYFGLSVPSVINGGGNLTSAPGLSVQQAYSIDKKIDDGLPQSGRVQANYVTGATPPYWAAGGGANGASPGAAATPSTTTCYDNGGNAASTMAYSVQQNNGSGVNCALSFQFQ